eukprot:m.79251 g.79251  ORF g.79251 m.79251 type:complete len:79 (+) comp14148_c0_seq4:56-292(+)
MNVQDLLVIDDFLVTCLFCRSTFLAFSFAFFLLFSFSLLTHSCPYFHSPSRLAFLSLVFLLLPALVPFSWPKKKIQTR